MQKSDKIWYVCYGSNLLESRFYCYIQGGQPKGAHRTYVGCRDKTLPEKTVPVELPHELYFAKSAQTWNGGGVAFVKPQKNQLVKTLGKAYLITAQQFIDLVKQEIDFTGILTLDFDKAQKEGRLLYRPESWYNLLTFLGEREGFPQFTFTNNQFLSGELNSPGEAYLSPIINGIKKTFPNISPSEIRNYFRHSPGLEGFDKEKFRKLIDPSH